MKQHVSRRVRRAATLAYRLRTAVAEHDRARLFLAESTGQGSEATYRRRARVSELRVKRATIRAQRALDRVPEQDRADVERYLQALLRADSILAKTSPAAIRRFLRWH
ncbi:hypothetical protein SHJG_p265 (plasmid) [Streptomyces hygroscopicus subsp. jinggangensis 5008]|nr:hypothetical protein SHJG_p265 [Streptomyces hygroscopicus subsp. jinggangensis 5008]AGF68534.1 hypothetical protein SHJGH_p265 [Streptomyces hygroscopicus subsp. jinggangensis TL01]